MVIVENLTTMVGDGGAFAVRKATECVANGAASMTATATTAQTTMAMMQV